MKMTTKLSPKKSPKRSLHHPPTKLPAPNDNSLIFSNARMTSSRKRKNMLHAVKNKAQVYYRSLVNLD